MVTAHDPEHGSYDLAGRPYVRIRAVAPGERDLWWVGQCPWPGIPSTYRGSAWRCCVDDGPTADITYVELHLPRKPNDFAFTVTIDVDAKDMPHLVEAHGFTVG